MTDGTPLVVVCVLVCVRACPQASNPSQLATMQKRLAEIRDTTYAPARGALDPAACVANAKAGGYWSPWLTLHH